MKRSILRSPSLAGACLFGMLMLALSGNAVPRDTGDGDGDEADPPALVPGYLDLRIAPRITGNAAAGREKSEACTACHGDDGIALVPSFPNLTGQHADFTYWQLVELKRGRHPSPMTPLVATLDDQDMRDMAVYYASLPVHPPAAATGSTAVDEAAEVDVALLERGHGIYLHGDAAKGIPPCQGCHGNDARGMPGADVANRNGYTPYASFPVLRGQQADYLQSKLTEYRNGDLHDSTGDFIMSGVGKRLDDDSIQAVSAWLSSLHQD